MTARPDPIAEPPDFIRSAGRAMHVIETVGNAGPLGLTVKQIASRCGLGQATAYHQIRTLTYLGYLCRRDDTTYVLGAEIAARFRELVTAYQGDPQVATLLRRAATHTGYTHLVARFMAGRVTITAMSVGAHSPLVEQFVPGFQGAAHATAFGKALLSTLSPDARRCYFKQHQAGMPARTELTLTTVDDLDRVIGKAENHGIYFDGGEYRRGLRSIAVVATPVGAQDPVALACLLSGAKAERPAHSLLEYANELAKLL